MKKLVLIPALLLLTLTISAQYPFKLEPIYIVDFIAEMVARDTTVRMQTLHSLKHDAYAGYLLKIKEDQSTIEDLTSVDPHQFIETETITVDQLQNVGYEFTSIDYIDDNSGWKVRIGVDHICKDGYVEKLVLMISRGGQVISTYYPVIDGYYNLYISFADKSVDDFISEATLSGLLE